MWIFVAVCSVLIVIVAIAAICYLKKRRYRKFLLQNSVCLERLNEINKRYTFYPPVSFDQSHTYDNENFYNDVSCRDYLIYQLQYLQKKICGQIEKVDYNRALYESYRKEVAEIRVFSQYRTAPEKLKPDVLKRQEAQLFLQRMRPAPCVRFLLSVTLFCAKINGQVYRKKSAQFSADEILILIKRLNKKSGSYYVDREIWDAICRVERGKVSNKMRFSIYARDHYRCRNCGVSDRFAKLEIDHIIPIAKGGKTTYDNLQTLCHHCNVVKGDK